MAELGALVLDKISATAELLARRLDKFSATSQLGARRVELFSLAMEKEAPNDALRAAALRGLSDFLCVEALDTVLRRLADAMDAGGALLLMWGGSWRTVLARRVG